MRRGMLSGWMRMTAVLAAMATGGTTLLQAPAQANIMHEAQERSKPHPLSELPKGRTDKLSAAQWKAVDAKRDKSGRHKAKLRLLTSAEMNRAHGRGPYRNRGFNGVLPWQKSLRDVNLCNGNLFKSFTDMQVSPARGAGLALQRTYNSNDERVGPFGIGWTHAYDIRMEEDPTNTPSDDSLNFADRTDFFGGKHKYHRDADGLYSPPAYLYDEMSSDYDRFLTDGPQNVLADTDKGQDGTVKHFTKVGNERICDSITDRYNSATLLTYHSVSIGGVSKALLDSVTDPSGRALNFVWQDLNAADPAHPAYRIVRVDGPQYSVGYSYNADFNLSACTLDAGDAAHLNRTSSYGYTTFTDGNGTETGLLASVTDSLGHSVSYAYSNLLPDVFGTTPQPTYTGTLWVSAITEPAGLDAQGNPRTQTWTLDRDVAANNDLNTPDVIALTDYNPQNPSQMGVNSLVVRVCFDDRLRAIQTSASLDGLMLAPTSNAYTTGYDSANNVVTSRADSALFNTPGPATYRAQVDMFTSTDLFTYGPHGNQLTHARANFPGVETTSYYNASQYFQKASATDMAGRTSTFGIGSNADPNPGNRGSVLWVRDAGYSDASSPSFNKQFNYAYNNFGQKTSETNLNGVVTQYTYGDPWGNLTQVVQDPHVSQGDSHLARTTSMSYDIGGHVLSSSDPMAHASLFVYTALGQPLSASTPATAATPAETVSYGYDGAGRALTVSDNRGVTTIAYEAGGDRVHSVTDPVTGTISYTYLKTGERASMSLPGGGTWNYGYSSAPGEFGQILTGDPNKVMRRLETITDDQGRRVEYAINPDGLPLLARTNEVYSAGSGTPSLLSYQQTEYTYDSTRTYRPTHRWLMQIKNTFHWLASNQSWQTKVLVQNDYTQDVTGQRLTNTISSLDATGNAVSRTEQYGYDALNRLKTVDYGDGQTQAYSFDATGNRLQKQDSAAGTENYSYNAANMLLSRGASSYSNDANGNTLTGGGRTNTWDSQNRLIQCVNGTNTSSFVYGSDGIRRQSTVNGNTSDFVLDKSMCVRERSHATGANLTTYFNGTRGPEYRREEGTGQVRWYLYDGLGCVLGEVNPNGNITSNRKYDVYGLVRGGNNAGGTSSHKFVGQFGHSSEDNSGLIYMRARSYDPVTGGFVSEDPGRHGTNWMTYCSDNPVNRVDPSGKIDAVFTQLELEVDDAQNAIRAFGLLRNVMIIIAGYAVAQQMAVLGVFMANQKHKPMGNNGAENDLYYYWGRARGLTDAVIRDMHKAGWTTAEGFTAEEIQEAMDDMAKNLSGDGSNG